MWKLPYIKQRFGVPWTIYKRTDSLDSAGNVTHSYTSYTGFTALYVPAKKRFVADENGTLVHVSAHLMLPYNKVTGFTIDNHHTFVEGNGRFYRVVDIDDYTHDTNYRCYYLHLMSDDIVI